MVCFEWIWIGIDLERAFQIVLLRFNQRRRTRAHARTHTQTHTHELRNKTERNENTMKYNRNRILNREAAGVLASIGCKPIVFFFSIFLYRVRHGHDDPTPIPPTPLHTHAIRFVTALSHFILLVVVFCSRVPWLVLFFDWILLLFAKIGFCAAAALDLGGRVWIVWSAVAICW